ncbi:MAG TPA: LL-diaminopimelate aminotransferase [bacterium]|nr:LL-diaminopimelate aminotransferase [bacterium]HOL46924.1 LL-diaminopimelate aminotransferase [bacterium]HPQ18314.1 LL-diaminopimelate aminotransferase [bacterium]
MNLSTRLEKIPPYLFMQLRNKINAAKSAGIDVISLAIGDPVEPTPDIVIDELYRAAKDPENHRYPTDEEKGMLAFRRAVADWYMRRYNVSLNPADEIIALIGSKEGCHHFALAVINPGDIVLMTDPGYPAYRSSIIFAGGEPFNVPIKAENNFLPNFADIDSDIAKKAKAMYLCYPNNPTGAIANKKFLQELIEFAKNYNILICYDNPYSEIVFDKNDKISFLSVEGAKDVGVELNSLSKPYNMTGWRIGMAVGNKDIISGISKVKENTDSGIFNAIQYAGIKALNECDNHINKMIELYLKRRSLVLKTFSELGLKNYNPPKGTFYLWLPVPDGMTSIDFATLLFEKSNVVVAAGSAYGKYGEGYIRISLTVKDERLKTALERIKNSGIKY